MLLQTVPTNQNMQYLDWVHIYRFVKFCQGLPHISLYWIIVEVTVSKILCLHYIFWSVLYMIILLIIAILSLICFIACYTRWKWSRITSNVWTIYEGEYGHIMCLLMQVHILDWIVNLNLLLSRKLITISC